MADAPNHRSYLNYIEIGVLFTVLIALVSVAFYMGTIHSRVEGFDTRVKGLEGLDGLSSERRKVIEEINTAKEKAVDSVSETIKVALDQATKALVEESHALQQTGIENISYAQRLAIRAIQESKGQADLATVSGSLRQSTSSPESKFERDLRTVFENVPDTSEFHLVVRKNQQYAVDSADVKFRSVTLHENSTLEVPSVFAEFILRTMRLEIKEGARIVARGDVGKDGNDGKKGMNGSICAVGADGERGGPGGRGTNGTLIEIFAIDVFLLNSLIVDTSGGSGGDGGQGGNGGTGGEASRSQGCRGGTGGTGGDGGSAGDGGNSGALSIRYVRAYSSGQEQIRSPRVRALVRHIATPGTAGLRGAAGNGGFGGPGRARNSLPRGDNGTDGSMGKSGSPGTRGSTTITQAQ